MKKILCLVVCAVFAAALPARAQSDEYRDAVAEMMAVSYTHLTLPTICSV